MGRGNWYKKWIDNHSFIVENDRLKDKAYIYSFYPKCDEYGFIDGNVRPYIYADFYSRYLRMKDNNVLLPIGFNTLSIGSFTESKKISNHLDDKVSDIYKSTLLELGVGINENKLINMRHDEYVSNLQSAFIDLYDRGYIEYKNTIVYYDEKKNKIYDSLNAPDNLPRIKEKCFVLKVDNIIKQIVKDIYELNIDSKIKEDIISYFNPKDILVMNLSLSSLKTIEVKIDKPEFIGAISYILINPEYIDIMQYIDPDEASGVMEYLESGTEPFSYSGTNAINPLTGNQIPIFVSTAHNTDVYLGMPSINQDDLVFANNAGFEVIDVLDEEGLLINSDFLNGLTKEEARTKIIKSFVECDMATIDKTYDKKEINLSSYDTFGALFPFLYDKGSMKLNSLKDFLPYNFNEQFRPQLNSNVNILGEALEGSINNLFVTGMSPFIAILYDEFNSSYDMLSDISKEEYKAWLPIKQLIVNSDSIIEELLMPIIFYNILKKELGYDLPLFCENVTIMPKIYDNSLNDINRANNNIIDFNKLLDEYFADSIRLFYLSQNQNDKFIFNNYDLSDDDKYVKYLREALLRKTDNDTSRLDFYFSDFDRQATRLIEDNKIQELIQLIKSFSIKYIIKEIPSDDNILLFLRIIFPVMPYLAEEVYEIKFNGRYSIINEGWPN